MITVICLCLCSFVLGLLCILFGCDDCGGFGFLFASWLLWFSVLFPMCCFV